MVLSRPVLTVLGAWHGARTAPRGESSAWLMDGPGQRPTQDHWRGRTRWEGKKGGVLAAKQPWEKTFELVLQGE